MNQNIINPMAFIITAFLVSETFTDTATSTKK